MRLSYSTSKSSSLSFGLTTGQITSSYASHAISPEETKTRKQKREHGTREENREKKERKRVSDRVDSKRSVLFCCSYLNQKSNESKRLLINGRRDTDALSLSLTVAASLFAVFLFLLIPHSWIQFHTNQIHLCQQTTTTSECVGICTCGKMR